MVVVDLHSALTPTQAARRLGVSADRVRQMAREGRLIPIQTPLGMLFRAKDIEELVLRRREAKLRRQRGEEREG